MTDVSFGNTAVSRRLRRDVAAAITAHDVELVQQLVCQNVRGVSGWMKPYGLELTISKIEIVVLTREKIPTVIPMKVGDVLVQTKRSVK